jgi:hypothetical protein
MPDIDQMTESPELRQLRDSMSAVPMPERPPLATIATRSRAHRRRQVTRATRVTVAGAVAAAGATAVVVSGAFTAAPRTGTIRTAAYTLQQNANGTDTLTLNPTELFDPAQLQSDLASYGVPAKVTSGSFCTSDPEPAGFAQVVSPPGGGTFRVGSGQQPSMTIDPSQMPSGTELSVADFQLTQGDLAGEDQADLDLINASSFTCTSTPPTLGPDTPGLGLLTSAAALASGR